MKKISIFGSTGSIGQKALKIAQKSNFEVVSISGNRNHKKLIEQAEYYHPKYVCVSDYEAFKIVKDALIGKDTEVLPESEMNNISKLETDCFVMAISGIDGLEPTFSTLGHTKRLAIATKEVIISAGDLLINFAKNYNTEIIPIDSEHSAIFQCIQGEKNVVKEIILTASGGPFVDFEEDDLRKVTLSDALKHPNWTMGNKITIDSATLINKVLEIIEASYLFNFQIENITPLIHPSSIIHGMVRFCDGSYKAVLSFPDMVFPISYALNYPNRVNCNLPDLDFCKLKSLSFKELKPWQKRNIDLAYYAFKEKKVIALNIANEYAVSEFLESKINFCDIYKIISTVLEKSPKEKICSLNDIKELRTIAKDNVFRKL